MTVTRWLLSSSFEGEVTPSFSGEVADLLVIGWVARTDVRIARTSYFTWRFWSKEAAVRSTASGFAEAQGRIFPLEGRIDGHEIEFGVTVDMPGHEAPFVFTGKVDGHEMTGVMDATGGEHPEAVMDFHGERTEG